MIPVKVHFGGRMPNSMESTEKPNGLRQVWIYNNIQQETSEDGSVGYVADGVCIETRLSDEQVNAQRNSYFTEPTPTIDERMTILEQQVVALKSFVNKLGKTELVGEGTYDNPFADDTNPINNAYYLRDGKKYVYMDGQWAEVDW